MTAVLAASVTENFFRQIILFAVVEMNSCIPERFAVNISSFSILGISFLQDLSATFPGCSILNSTNPTFTFTVQDDSGAYINNTGVFEL